MPSIVITRASESQLAKSANVPVTRIERPAKFDTRLHSRRFQIICEKCYHVNSFYCGDTRSGTPCPKKESTFKYQTVDQNYFRTVVDVCKRNREICKRIPLLKSGAIKYVKKYPELNFFPKYNANRTNPLLLNRPLTPREPVKTEMRFSSDESRVSGQGLKNWPTTSLRVKSYTDKASYEGRKENRL